MNVNLTDGQTHNLELYFLDWDTTARSEQVNDQQRDLQSGAGIPRRFSSFHSGVYLGVGGERERDDQDHEAKRWGMPG